MSLVRSLWRWVKITLLWNVTPCSLICTSISDENSVYIFKVEDFITWRWRRQALQKLDICLLNYTSSHLWRKSLYLELHLLSGIWVVTEEGGYFLNPRSATVFNSYRSRPPFRVIRFVLLSWENYIRIHIIYIVTYNTIARQRLCKHVPTNAQPTVGHPSLGNGPVDTSRGKEYATVG
jgi:hypothetical protein